MSEITNNPIVLDSTGQVIVEKMKQQNALLAMIAEGQRDNIYSDITTIAHMVRTNDLDSIRNMFPIGDQIILPWKDMDDTNHNTDETAYQVAWDIVHHELVTPRTAHRYQACLSRCTSAPPTEYSSATCRLS